MWDVFVKEYVDVLSEDTYVGGEEALKRAKGESSS